MDPCCGGMGCLCRPFDDEEALCARTVKVADLEERSQAMGWAENVTKYELALSYLNERHRG